MIKATALPAQLRFKGRIFDVRHFPQATIVYGPGGIVWLRAFAGSVYEYRETDAVVEPYAAPTLDASTWLSAAGSDAQPEAEVPWLRVQGTMLRTDLWLSEGAAGETIVTFGQDGDAWGDSTHAREDPGHVRWDPTKAAPFIV